VNLSLSIQVLLCYHELAPDDANVDAPEGANVDEEHHTGGRRTLP
jgi:hypothetical protein